MLDMENPIPRSLMYKSVALTLEHTAGQVQEEVLLDFLQELAYKGTAASY